MSPPVTLEKGKIGPEHVENVQNNTVLQQQTHYKARNDEEKSLDRRLNLKLDLVVVSLLAIEFIVRSSLSERPK